MKIGKYEEGQKALENFERGMKTLFKATKIELPRKKQPNTATAHKKKEADSGKV